MMVFLFVLILLLMVCTTIWVATMYDVYVPEEPNTELENKCIDIKERLRWLNWKLQEQRLKAEESS